MPWEEAGELCPVKTSPCTAHRPPAPRSGQQIRCGTWETKVFYFLASFSVLFELGLTPALWRSWLEQPGSWSRQGAGTHPAASPFPPSLPPCRAVKGHAVKLLAEGKQSHGDGARPSSVLAPRAHGQWLLSRSRRLAVPCLGSTWDMGEGSLQTQCQALTCWGKASSPLGTAKSHLLSHRAALALPHGLNSC